MALDLGALTHATRRRVAFSDGAGTLDTGALTHATRRRVVLKSAAPAPSYIANIANYYRRMRSG